MASDMSDRQPLLATQHDEVIEPRAGDAEPQGQHPATTTYSSLLQEPHFLLKMCSTMLNFFDTGIIVSAIGALIPSIEAYYQIGDSTTGFIFPCGVAGYLCSTICIEYIHAHYGRRGLVWISPIARLGPLLVLSCAPPLPWCFLAYVVLGFGYGLGDCSWCAWAATNPHFPNVVSGFLHGAYGVGSITGPLIAVRVVEAGLGWYSIYRLISLIVFVELLIQAVAFRHDTAKTYSESASSKSVDGVLRPALRRLVLTCAMFVLVDVAVESAYTDWIVVFMKRSRHASFKTSGFAASSFWVGMTLGRFGLGFVTEHVGLRRSVVAYIMISIGLQIVFLVVKTAAMSLVVLGLNGFVLGPIFPSALTLLTSKVPEASQVNAVTIAAACGQLGAAIIPLGIGFLAQYAGIGRMLSLVLLLSGCTLVLWLLFCRLA
jgi:fucose permease